MPVYRVEIENKLWEYFFSQMINEFQICFHDFLYI